MFSPRENKYYVHWFIEYKDRRWDLWEITLSDGEKVKGRYKYH